MRQQGARQDKKQKERERGKRGVEKHAGGGGGEMNKQFKKNRGIRT